MSSEVLALGVGESCQQPVAKSLQGPTEFCFAGQQEGQARGKDG
jgi:hypothetical protein